MGSGPSTSPTWHAAASTGFWEMKLKPWDMAPGILLITEAGGLVADFSASPEHAADGEICAATPRLHPELLAVLAEARGAAQSDP